MQNCCLKYTILLFMMIICDMDIVRHMAERKKRWRNQRIMQHFMSKYSDWTEITLVTPKDKVENIEFYTKHFGFEIIGEEDDDFGGVYIFRR